MNNNKLNSIAILVPCLAYGGAERQISLIAPRLKEEGHKIIVISMMKPVAFTELFHEKGIPVYDIEMTQGKYSLGAFFRIVRILKEHQVKTMITFNFPANFAGRIIKLLYPRMKLVTSIRNSTFGARWRTLFMKMTRRLDYKTVPNSSNVGQDFAAKGIIPASKLNVIRNGIEVIDDQTLEEKIKPMAQAIRADILKDHPNHFLWVAVGRHESLKDYPNLINACNLLNQHTDIPWHLAMVGRGTLKEQTRGLIREYGLEDKITLVEEQSYVMPFYLAADAYVSSSAWEGMPNTVMESMMTGTPGVATDVGEVSQLITPGVNGLMVQPRDAQALSDAMQYLMELPVKERLEIGRKARAFVWSNLSIDQVMLAWKELVK